MNEIETIYDHIELEYKHLDEIRKNITYLTRRMSGFHNYTRFTNNSSDARMLIDTYTQLYGIIINHIEFLYEKANSYLNRRNLSRQSENSISGNYAFINGMYYHLDNIEGNIPGSSNTNNVNTQENSNNERNQGNQQRSSNNSTRQTTRSPRSPISLRRATPPNLSEHSQSIWNTPTANPSRQHSLFGTPRTHSIDSLLQQVNNLNTMPSLQWGTGTNNMNASTTSPFLTNNNRSVFDNLTNEFIRTFSEPVTVAPSADQIRDATTNIAFSEIEEPMNLQCPISLEVFQPSTIVTQILHCRHAFLPSSFQTWFDSNVRCPICRHDIRENIPSGSQEPNTNSEQSSTSPSVNTEENEENEENEEDTTENLPPLIPIEEEEENNFQDIEMGPVPQIGPPLPEPMPEPNQQTNTSDIPNIQNNEFTNIVESMLNEAVRNMAHDPSGNQQNSPNLFTPLNLNPNTIGTAIFNNIMNNNYRNVEFDPSNNQVRFETTVFDSSWNPPSS